MQRPRDLRLPARGSHNTALLRAAAELLPPLRRASSSSTGSSQCPPYDEDDDIDRAAPRAVAAASGGDRRRRRDSDRHPGVQLLDSGPAQERARLGLPPGRRRRALRQARRRHRRQHRHVRCGLGPGGGPQGPRRLGRPGARRELPVAHADEAFTEDGRLADPELRDQLEEILAELVALAEQAAPSAARRLASVSRAPSLGWAATCRPPRASTSSTRRPSPPSPSALRRAPSTC